MAFQPGYLSAFYLANAANALQNLSPYSDNLSLPQSRDQLDVSAFGTMRSRSSPASPVATRSPCPARMTW